MRQTPIPAFTLIEVMVATAIIAILAAVTLVSMSAYRVHAQLKRASHEFTAALREAQNYALTGRTTPPPTGHRETCGYGVLVYPTSYQVSTIEKKASGSCGEVPILNQTTIALHFFDSGVGYVQGGNPHGIGFTFPRAETVMMIDSVDNEWVGFSAPFTFAFVKGGITYHICVYPSGRVEEVGTATSCP